MLTLHADVLNPEILSFIKSCCGAATGAPGSSDLFMIRPGNSRMCENHPTHNRTSRRHLLMATGVLATGAAVELLAAAQAAPPTAQNAATAPSADINREGMSVSNADTAVVFIDPQNDVLSEKGVNWSAVRASVTENGTVEHLAQIFEAAKANRYHVFISPHYFYPTDVNSWKFVGPLEAEEVANHSFARRGPLDLSGFEGSGADWLDRFKPYIEDGKTIVVSPHKVWGPQTNDLVLQLRKRGIQKVILGGMLANMCVESHLRELLEQGFQIAVIKDATAGPRHPVWGDGYQAALINYNFLAHEVWTTAEVVGHMQANAAAK
jgi:nicotinamidase-related amidase